MFESLTQALGKAFTVFQGQKKLTEKNMEEGLRAVRAALLEADVHFKVARTFIQRVKERALGEEVLKSVQPGQQFIKIFHDELTALMGPEEPPVTFSPSGFTVYLLAGLQGSGKTTTCAKLALFLRKRYKKNPILVAADLQRPAAVDQLAALGKQLDVPVYTEPTTARPPELCKRAVAQARLTGHDVAILDTAGRLHVDEELMAELEEIHAQVQPHAVYLVSDAMTGQDAVQSAKAFHERLPLTGVILTKLDGDARGGAAMSIKAVTGRPILLVGVGEKPDDLEPFHPERMAGRILGMGDVVSLVEKAQEVVDREEAEKAQEKLLKGRFNLEDFYKQLQWIKKLGPLKKVMGMLPGMGGLLDQLDFEDKHFKRLEAIFTSMTPEERKRPEIIDGSRRRRIARGSGNDVQAVHDLLKQFKMAGKLFKQVGKMDPRALEGLAGGGPPRKGFRTPGKKRR